MHIKINSEDELKEIAATLLHLSVNLLHYSTLWNIHHGHELLERKKYFENGMREFLNKLEATKTHHPSEVHISIKNKEHESGSDTVPE